MQGVDARQGSVFSYVSLEARVPSGHPLRRIREMVDDALVDLSPEFEVLYSKICRPSIPPEKLLRGHHRDGAPPGLRPASGRASEGAGSPLVRWQHLPRLDDNT